MNAELNFSSSQFLGRSPPMTSPIDSSSGDDSDPRRRGAGVKDEPKSESEEQESDQDKVGHFEYRHSPGCLITLLEVDKLRLTETAWSNLLSCFSKPPLMNHRD